MARFVIDAGHGGSDNGATYEGRREKDDNLRLALAVGEILENNGADVVYTRTTDVYNTPFEKATIGNNANGDYFISFHRNAVPIPNTATGIETLVYQDKGVVSELARNINSELEKLGFNNRGVIERPNLVVLRRTRMPAILIETGFIDNEQDNAKFDAEFEQIAQAIVNGIMQTVSVVSEDETTGADVTTNSSRTDRVIWSPEDSEELIQRRPVYPVSYPQQRPCRPLYRVQVGAFRNYDNATRVLNNLQMEGFPAFVIREEDLFKVQAGAYQLLENAIRLERRLRELGYNTYIITGCK